MSWFDQEFQYRIEEGEPSFEPSKIEAVRKDGEDFDDGYIANLHSRMERSFFPRSKYRLEFETDDFRRYIRIFIDSPKSKILKVGKKTVFELVIVPKAEIAQQLSLEQ